MNINDILLTIAGFIVVIFLTGCSSYIAGQHYPELTKEQIEGLHSIGHEVISCITVGGPPLGGRTTKILRPKTSAGTVTFTPDCQIREVTVDSSGNAK